VALKVLLAGSHADAERRARFLAEADAFARLRHPNIVPIYEVGEHDGLPFLALEYVEEGSLADRLGGVPLPLREAAALVEELAKAVHFAHKNGVIHRDLKPANIVIAADGSPKIADFGLAKQEQGGLTATGAVLGTPSFYEKRRDVKPVFARFCRTLESFPLKAVFCLYSVWTVVPPSPRLSSVWSSGVPLGLVVHPSMAVSTHLPGRRPMMVWERGARFYKSWVRNRPKGRECSSPRGST
jgi:serine/threonine-protein kinase